MKNCYYIPEEFVFYKFYVGLKNDFCLILQRVSNLYLSKLSVKIFLLHVLALDQRMEPGTYLSWDLMQKF